MQLRRRDQTIRGTLLRKLEMRVVRQAQQGRSEKTRAEILGIALEQFSTRGFDAVSLREIAEMAGVNHAMIRYYFGGKESLWRESVTYLFDRFAQEIAPPLRGAQGYSRKQRRSTSATMSAIARATRNTPA
ncbi:TetR/AcrR family transcriptional regulator [Cupriavidus sp. D39]|uniref:TetR/AcrR family transcriptional regulator n=1 Tax=Cupriavidus sp. D39 TaxID=2997877 RepID=UPI00226DEC45|nr:TetR family transcriptional regulator [Cupriavidus sp. D39]MCY0854096.1 TetR family transcriptional regulator [Cupriavidus sp. D39]